jgi:amino acid transporter
MGVEETDATGYLASKGKLSDVLDHDGESIQSSPRHTLQRKLENRHIAMVRYV